MRTVATALAVLAALAGAATAQDEQTKQVAQQKKAAQAAWDSLEIGTAAFAETKHLLIYAPRTMQGHLRAASVLLEKYHDQAVKVTGLDPKEGYPGKITVYLLPGREHMTAFARRVERRRPTPGETGSFQADDDRLHAAGCVTTGKPPVPVEARAGQQVAALILKRKAGRATQLPDWLLAGFGRATSNQVSPKEKFVLEDRKQARLLARRYDAGDVWGGTLEAEQVGPLQASLAEFLTYGPGRKRLPKFLAGFQPEAGMATRTTPQALEAAGLTVDKVARAWRNWLAGR
jgi:hypothetical protein